MMGWNFKVMSRLTSRLLFDNIKTLWYLRIIGVETNEVKYNVSKLFFDREQGMSFGKRDIT